MLGEEQDLQPTDTSFFKRVIIVDEGRKTPLFLDEDLEAASKHKPRKKNGSNTYFNLPYCSFLRKLEVVVMRSP